MTRARYLRKNPTRYEKILWRHLRNRKFANHKFRRQHPIDCYVLDFYCPEARLAIELDGSGHNHIGREMQDVTRTKFLTSQGISVLRFWNCQIRTNVDSVLEAIWCELKKCSENNPSPQSSPFGKGRGSSR